MPYFFDDERFTYGYGGYYNLSKKGVKNTIYEGKLNYKNNKKLIIDDEELVTLGNYTSSGLTITLFATHTSTGISQYHQGCRIYFCEFTQKNLTIREIIPCKCRSDNKIGLYDIVEGKFYTNQGTGEFIAGPKV